MLALKVAFKQLVVDARSQRLRTLLTVLGITWGTVALSLLLAFGHGLHENMRSNLASVGDNVVFVFMNRTYKSWEGFKKGRPLNLTDEDMEAVRNQAVNLGAISPCPSWGLLASVGPKNMMVDINGVQPDYFAIRRFPPLPEGRHISGRDVEEGRRVAFIGYRVATQLFGEENPLGKEFLVNGAPFAVVGVLDKEDGAGGDEGRDSDAVFVPLTTYRALTGQQQFHFFLFKPRDPLRNKETVESVRQVLARRLQFDPTDKGAFDYDDFTEFAKSADSFMGAISLLLGTAGVLTLVAGGVGVSNIMRVSVEERMHEIGIRMALGAKSGFILVSFLLETLLLTTFGGALGLAAAYGVIAVFPRFNLKEFVGTPSLAPVLYLVIVVVLGLIGLAAGYGPARRASRMDPVLAMKL